MTYLDLAAEHRTLYAAFLKARTWLWEQPYYDVVEIKLFEWNLTRNLDDLSKKIRDGHHFSPLTGYYIPKDIESARPYAYRSFEDEVAATAAVLALGPRMEREMNRGGAVSFGNRLDRDFGSDRLYVPWDIAWDRFSRACGRAGRYAPWHVRTDVKRFYPEIPLDRLDGILRSVLPRDPIYTFFARLNAVPCPLLKRGRGIPAGPATSGFIANLYLLPLDREIKFRWNAADRFRRYVDDIFYFARTRGGARRVHHSLSRLMSERFGLRLHDARKSEIAFDRDPVGSGSAPDEWEYAAGLFDRVFTSIYKIDRTLWRRFKSEPDRFLKWYVRGLRWLGIFVSTDWLAQRLLTIQAKGHGSRWLSHTRHHRLNFPDVELYGVERWGMKGWAEDFARRNPAFMRDVARLHTIVKRLTREAYGNLGDVRRQSRRDLKGKVFAVRFFASRLAMMRCDRVEPIYRMLMDHTWILDPTIGINAFISMPRAFGKIAGYLDRSRPELVRAKAAWALGELGDRRAGRILWESAKHGGGHIARRSALEALLRLDHWDDLPAEWVASESENESDPAIRKYYYLILGRMRPPNLEAILERAAAREENTTAQLAVKFAAHETGSLYRIAGAFRRVGELPANVPLGHPGERR